MLRRATRVSSPDLRSRTARAPSRRRRSPWWLVRVWVLVVLFAVVTLAGSYGIGIPVRDPHGKWFVSRVAVSLGLFVVLSLVDAGRRTSHPRTVTSILQTWRHRWTRRRLALVMGGLLAYHLVYLCYHNLKSWNAFNHPHDAMLRQWDLWLFLGRSPAVLLHDLLGQHAAAYVLTAVYVSFTTVVTVSFVSALVFPRRVRQGFVFIASAMWVWILGVGSYYLVPSIGPFHSAPQQYADLPPTVAADTQQADMAERAHLLAHPLAPDAHAQVAAFASLHVAMVCLIVLTARYYGLRLLSRAMAVYLVATIVATVYLGWHFAVDGIAGLVIAFLAVFLGRCMVYPARAWRGR